MATTHLTIIVLAMLVTITLATGIKSNSSNSSTLMKNEKKRNLLPSPQHNSNDKSNLQNIVRNTVPTLTSRKHKIISSSTKTTKINSTASLVENNDFNNNTKRWLESSYARGYHDTHPNTGGGGLDETTSMYEDKGLSGVGSSRQNYFTGSSDQQDVYGNDIEAYLKPGYYNDIQDIVIK